MSEKMKAAFFSDNTYWVKGGHIIDLVFGQGRRQQITDMTDLYPEIITSENFEEHASSLSDLEVIFSTWEMPKLTGEQVKKMPALKAVLYAAGATRMFRDPFEQNGVAVCSATAANGIPVAEFALSQILLSGAGYWYNTRNCIDEHHTEMFNNFRGFGNYGKRVAILGNGTISNYLQDFLRHHTLEVVVVPSRASSRTVSLEEAFETSFAVVNLFPDRDDNAGILSAGLFRRMIRYAVFINLGRGRQVNELDLAAVMDERPDLTALLDVQYPEPPKNGSKLYSLSNVQLTSHIAGSKAAELVRMADYMIEDFHRLEKGEPLKYQVQAGQL
jgi:phosphoglycerate dehydrogenase-like enzyme